MKTNSKPRLSPAFALEEFDGEILLYDEAGSRAFYLNDTANAVLQLCTEDLSVAQIIECLQQNYPEHTDAIAEDVASVLEVLVENQVIELSDE
jgi:hypothetical protein